MRTIKLCVLVHIWLAAVVFAQTPSDRIIAEALKPSSLNDNLEQLTDRIGGRVPGTPAMQKAVGWGVAAFQAAGADSVHTEDFKIRSSWAEGATRMSVTAWLVQGVDQKSSFIPTEEFPVRVVSPRP